VVNRIKIEHSILLKLKRIYTAAAKEKYQLPLQPFAASVAHKSGRRPHK